MLGTGLAKLHTILCILPGFLYRRPGCAKCTGGDLDFLDIECLAGEQFSALVPHIWSTNYRI